MNIKFRLIAFLLTACFAFSACGRVVNHIEGGMGYHSVIRGPFAGTRTSFKEWKKGISKLKLSEEPSTAELLLAPVGISAGAAFYTMFHGASVPFDLACDTLLIYGDTAGAINIHKLEQERLKQEKVNFALKNSKNEIKVLGSDSDIIQQEI